MDYSVYDAQRCGFERVVFVIREEDEARFRERIERMRCSIRAEFAWQRLDDLPNGFRATPTRVKPWGTGHAVLSVERQITGPFALINADDFYGASSFALLHTHLTSVSDSPGPVFAFVGFKLQSNLSDHGGVTRGVCRCDADGFLQEISEVTNVREHGGNITGSYAPGDTRSLTGEEMVSANMWAFTPDIFPLLRSQFVDFLSDEVESAQAEFLIPEAVNTIVREGQARFKILPASDPVFGMTHPQDKPSVQRRIRSLIESGSYPDNLFT